MIAFIVRCCIMIWLSLSTIITVGYFSGSLVDTCQPLSVIDSQLLLRELWDRHYYWAIVGLVGILIFHLPYYYSIGRWFFRLPKKYIKSIAKDCAGIAGSVNPIYEPEKFVVGSDYFPQERPSFQVELFIERRPGTWEFIGGGWRLGDHLVTAHHVVAEQMESRVNNDLRVMAGDKFVDMDSTRFRVVDCDLAVALLPISAWTTLSVKSARVPKMALSGAAAVFAQSRGKATSGACKPYHAIPYITYEGSTAPGFSGSPLYVGGTVYAMHIGAGKCNLGLDSNWIKAAVLQGESSEDYVYEEIAKNFSRGRTTKYKSFDNEEAYILSGGRYVRLDLTSVPEHIRDMLEYAPSNVKLEGESVMHFDNEGVDEPSKHLNLRRASAHAEARRLKAAGPVSKPVFLTKVDPLKSTAMKENMDGLESTLAQLSRVLNTISRSRSERKNSAGSSMRHSRSRVRRC